MATTPRLSWHLLVEQTWLALEPRAFEASRDQLDSSQSQWTAAAHHGRTQALAGL